MNPCQAPRGAETMVSLRASKHLKSFSEQRIGNTYLIKQLLWAPGASYTDSREELFFKSVLLFHLSIFSVLMMTLLTRPHTHHRDSRSWHPREGWWQSAHNSLRCVGPKLGELGLCESPVIFKSLGILLLALLRHLLDRHAQCTRFIVDAYRLLPI